MGVDINVIKAYGYLIDASVWDKFVKTNPETTSQLIEMDAISVCEQNNFGDLLGEAKVLLCMYTHKKTLVSRTIGGTPWSFLSNQVYTEPNDQVKTVHGGARTYFSVAKYGCENDIPVKGAILKKEINLLLPLELMELIRVCNAHFNCWIFGFYN